MSTTTSEVSVDELVAQACARNVPIELHYEQDNGPLIVGRARLFDYDHKYLLADRPLCLDQTGTIPSGKKLSIHLLLNGKRYYFESVIKESDRMVRLNDHQQVRGIALQRPKAFQISQRRAHLRISMVGYDPISVGLVKPYPDIPTACPVDAPIYNGWMVDLSVGGFSVLLDHHILYGVRAKELFFLTFVLPGYDEEFFMLGSVRHSRVIEVSESIRIAMCFHGWNARQLKRDRRRLSQFVAAHERRMLRRRK